MLHRLNVTFTFHSKVVCLTPAKKNYNLQIIPRFNSGKLDFLSRETTVSSKSPLFAGGENGLGCIDDRCKDAVYMSL